MLHMRSNFILGAFLETRSVRIKLRKTSKRFKSNAIGNVCCRAITGHNVEASKTSANDPLQTLRRCFQSASEE
jgi:hypothetical protein